MIPHDCFPVDRDLSLFLPEAEREMVPSLNEVESRNVELSVGMHEVFVVFPHHSQNCAVAQRSPAAVEQPQQPPHGRARGEHVQVQHERPLSHSRKLALHKPGTTGRHQKTHCRGQMQLGLTRQTRIVAVVMRKVLFWQLSRESGRKQPQRGCQPHDHPTPSSTPSAPRGHHKHDTLFPSVSRVWRFLAGAEAAEFRSFWSQGAEKGTK